MVDGGLGGCASLLYSLDVVFRSVPRNMRLRKATDYTARGSLAVQDSSGTK